VSTDLWPAAVTLTGDHVRLEPLDPSHLDELVANCAADPEVFRWVWPYDVPDAATMHRVTDLAFAERDAGTRIPFAQRRMSDGQVVGSTSYLDLSQRDRHVEIGWTFLSRGAWRTPINTEAKFLLLGHAFDDLGCERVSLKTDHLNLRSQRAIERLGATREGVLRHRQLRADGTWRDTVYYSILRDEWPDVRYNLQQRLATP